MKLLVVVTPPSIYHGCSTRKASWEEKFTGKKQDFFESVKMRNCGPRNVKKHKEIKGSDKCVTLNMHEILNISEKFDDLDKMETTSSESKVKMEGSGKWLLTALALKTKARPTLLEIPMTIHQCARFFNNTCLVHKRSISCLEKYLASTSTYMDLPFGIKSYSHMV